MKWRCGRCGRRVGIYLNEVSGRYVAHVIPFALHRAVLTQESADPVHPPMPVGHIRACGCPECVAWLEAHEPADPVRCPKCGAPHPFHDPACVVHPDLIQDHTNRTQEES